MSPPTGGSAPFTLTSQMVVGTRHTSETHRWGGREDQEFLKVASIIRAPDSHGTRRGGGVGGGVSCGRLPVSQGCPPYRRETPPENGTRGYYVNLVVEEAANSLVK